MLIAIRRFICISLILNLPPARGEINIDAKFHEWKIVPDIIKHSPPQLCNVTFKNITIQPGDFVPRSITFKQPEVTFNCRDSKKWHTLYMIATTNGTILESPLPDDASNPLDFYVPNYWHNWIHINIPGNQVRRGQYLYDYIWPLNPQAFNILDRYAILIYEQSYKIFPPKPAYGNRYQWQEFLTLQDFVDDFSLRGPIAGNFWHMLYEPNYTVPFRGPP